MKYFSIETVVNAYKGFQDCMTNKSWGYLALLKGCKDGIRPSVPYEVDLDIVSNFLEGIFNLSQTKRSYDSGRSLYVVFSNKWDHYFNDQGRHSPNIYDVIVWAYRRKSFDDSITNKDIVSIFAKEFNIPSNIIMNSFKTKTKNLTFTNSLYSESQLKNELGEIGVDVTGNNIDAKKGGVVAAPGEISRGPFVQTLYAGLEITDYVIILQSEYYSLYGKDENLLFEINDKNPSLQQIFYGAPGTGKSHKIKNDEKVKKADEKDLVFRTTFHPDSDYSTFVGAYKPTIAKRAVRNVAGDIVKNTEKEDVYEDSITYSFVPQAFLQAYVAAWNHPEDDVFLIIEEINRGNCAQIFGDLFQLLDRNCDGYSDYPIMADKDLAKYLCGKDEEGKDILINKEGIKNGKLRLPKYLYIWATMNTSDQSLFPIDSAFKRRWEWVYQPIDTKKETWYIKVGGHYYSWTAFLDKVNDELLTEETQEDKHLGFYFCKATEKKEGTESTPNVITKETFVGKVLFYLWNDVFKVYGIPPSIGSSKEWPYHKFYRTSGEVDEDKVVALMEKLHIAVEDDNEEKEEKAES